MWVVIPVKDFDAAKQRLSGLLDADERRALATAMLEDVAAAAAGARGCDAVALATRDATAIDLAAAHGFAVIEDRDNAGHSAALAGAVAELRRRGVDAMATLPGDIPLVTAPEIDALLAAHDRLGGMTIAPSGDKRGSNGVVLTPPDAVPLRFGPDSFLPHLDAARARGIEPRIVERPGFALDIDTGDDLRRLAASGGDTRSHAFLRRSGVAARLAAPLVGAVA